MLSSQHKTSHSLVTKWSQLTKQSCGLSLPQGFSAFHNTAYDQKTWPHDQKQPKNDRISPHLHTTCHFQSIVVVLRVIVAHVMLSLILGHLSCLLFCFRIHFVRLHRRECWLAVADFRSPTRSSSDVTDMKINNVLTPLHIILKCCTGDVIWRQIKKNQKGFEKHFESLRSPESYLKFWIHFGELSWRMFLCKGKGA